MSKMHGSLTQAGKVRKKTPVVPKQDRAKKALTGRAKKRKQYQKKYQLLLPTATAASKKRYKANKQEVK